jgi:Uma2 family endonuclease
MKRKKGVAMSTNSVQVADQPTPVVTGQTGATTLPALNGHHSRNGVFARPKLPTLMIHERELPTFPIETGFWERFDADTNTYHRYPLTLLDLLFPDQNELGVLVMPESPLHDLWSGQLAFTIRANLKSRNWLILHDVFIYWPQRFVPPAAPDLAIIPDAPVLAEGTKSYQVGRDGPPPIFVAELISESSRTHDLETKRTYYASVGVKEYLVVDQLPLTDGPWQVYGYRLEHEPYYTPIPQDKDGGVTFTGVGLRFVPVGRTRIDIYDLTTDERLLTPDELKARADSAEARVAELEAILRSKGLLPPA